MNTANPHSHAQVLHLGTPLAEAKGAVVLLHGRGDTAANFAQIATYLATPGVAFLVPGAAGNTWYPQSFLAPRPANEPYLSSALALIAELIASTGLPSERVAVAGFSQGACLSTEFVASHPARYAGLIAFTGGLVGPPGSDLRHAGDLAGTPALLLCGDPDPHIPWARIEESAAELKRMGAHVDVHRYPGRPHTISAEEGDLARRLLAGAFA